MTHAAGFGSRSAGSVEHEHIETGRRREIVQGPRRASKGFVTIRGGDPLEVPDELRQFADELAGSCPETAISLIDD